MARSLFEHEPRATPTPGGGGAPLPGSVASRPTARSQEERKTQTADHTALQMP